MLKKDSEPQQMKMAFLHWKKTHTHTKRYPYSCRLVHNPPITFLYATICLVQIGEKVPSCVHKRCHPWGTSPLSTAPPSACWGGCNVLVRPPWWSGSVTWVHCATWDHGCRGAFSPILEGDLLWYTMVISQYHPIPQQHIQVLKSRCVEYEMGRCREKTTTTSPVISTSCRLIQLELPWEYHKKLRSKVCWHSDSDGHLFRCMVGCTQVIQSWYLRKILQ